MIHVENVCKFFGVKNALENISFHIERGEYVALLGINGAGKTTLTRILATLTRPTSGSIQIAGYSPKKNPLEIRRSLGVMSHDSFLYGDLTAEENLRFYASMYDVKDRESRIGHLLTQVGLQTRRYDRVATFSRGMQQRLALARAILHSPPILLLDEPFAGLDINATEMLKRLLDELIAKDSTVLLTVHDIEYALKNAHRVLVLQNGKLIRDESARTLTYEQTREALSIP